MKQSDMNEEVKSTCLNHHVYLFVAYAREENNSDLLS